MTYDKYLQVCKEERFRPASEADFNRSKKRQALNKYSALNQSDDDFTLVAFMLIYALIEVDAGRDEVGEVSHDSDFGTDEVDTGHSSYNDDTDSSYDD